MRLGPGALRVPILAETELEVVLDVLAAEAPEGVVAIVCAVIVILAVIYGIHEIFAKG